MSHPSLRVLSLNAHKGFTLFNRRFILQELREAVRAVAADLVFLQEVIGTHAHHARRHKNWPALPQYEYLADTLWTDSPPAEVLATSREQFQRAPSAKSFELFFVSTGTGPTPLPEGAYSMWARALILCYAVWERPEDDTANAQWHRTTIAALDRYAVGHYVGESDIVTDPTRAERSYSKANWERLRALRRQYDPEGLFHGHFGSVTN